MPKARNIRLKSKNRSNKDSEVDTLIKTAKAASKKAISESQAFGLTITYIEGNDLIERSADGIKKKIKEIPKSPINKANIRKGAILCLK